MKKWIQSLKNLKRKLKATLHYLKEYHLKQNTSLKNGTKAFIRDSPDKEKSIISLTFKRDKYQYILYGFKSKYIKKETLIEIAESIQ